MRRSILCLFASLLLNAGVVRSQTAAPSPSALTVIRAGTLIDGTSAAARKNQLIFVRGERIEKVTDASAAIPAEAQIIDLSNATVLPGLIDSHTHIFLWGEDPKKGGYDANILNAGIALRAARATFAARRALEQGFTTIRDLETEGAGYGDIEIKQRSRKERFRGRESSAQRGRFRRPAGTTWRDMRRNWTCPRAHSLWTARWRRARPRGSSSSTARIGSRFI